MIWMTRSFCFSFSLLVCVWLCVCSARLPNNNNNNKTEDFVARKKRRRFPTPYAHYTLSFYFNSHFCHIVKSWDFSIKYTFPTNRTYRGMHTRDISYLCKRRIMWARERERENEGEKARDIRLFELCEVNEKRVERGGEREGWGCTNAPTIEQTKDINGRNKCFCIQVLNEQTSNKCLNKNLFCENRFATTNLSALFCCLTLEHSRDCVKSGTERERAEGVTAAAAAAAVREELVWRDPTEMSLFASHYLIYQLNEY